MIRTTLFCVLALGFGFNVLAKETSDDPFYFNATIASGTYKGQKINTTLKRAVSKLDGTQYQAGIEIPEGYNLIANFYHNKKFYLALIPKYGVEQVLFLSEPFGGIFSHSMLRFRMNKPIRLVAEVPNEEEFKAGVYARSLESPIELYDLIVSVEATSPPGIKEFSLLASFFSTRGLVMRVISLTGRGVSKLLKSQAHVVQMPLDLTRKEANRALRNALEQSEEWGMSHMYNTALKNCNSACFNLLEKAKSFFRNGQNRYQYMLSSVQAIASRVVVFSKLYPPLARLGITWRSWRTHGAPDERNLEDDPEFHRLARTYPGVCEDLALPANLSNDPAEQIGNAEPNP